MLNDKKITAIICECNPFHKGHKRLIDAAKKDADYIIAIMSGNFVQRGEPSIYDKYKRTSDLLKNGVDMVIEIPIEYVLSSAHYFAKVSISIIKKLNIVDNIIFGSNINDIEKLKSISNIDDKKVKKYMKDGLSYPAALSKCYNIKLMPNDILAVEYLKAIKEQKLKINTCCIKRKDDLPTATKLREKLKKKITNDSFSSILTYKIYSQSQNELSTINTISNDLSYAIKNTGNKNLSFEKRAKLLNTKNRTLAQIKRAFLNIIFDIKKSDMKTLKYGEKIPYIRILGIKKEAMPLLKKTKIPYLMSYAPSSYKNVSKKILSSNTLKTNVSASNLYYLLSNDKENEATKPLIIV